MSSVLYEHPGFAEMHTQDEAVVSKRMIGILGLLFALSLETYTGLS